MTVFDIETDGFLEDLTKIHVVSYSYDGKEVFSIHDYDEMRQFFSSHDYLIGHDIHRFDIPAVEKVLGIKVKATLVDTLPLSWYINFSRVKHGLEGYGEDYGIPKPVVTDWQSLTKEDYAHRCEEDVKINSRLWRDLWAKLMRLYQQDEAEAQRLIDYLSFKMACAAEQQALGWRLDVAKAQEHYETLLKLEEEKVVQLAEAMPPRPLYANKTKPKVMYKKDGSLSQYGEAWVSLMKDMRLPESTETVKVLTGYEKANPGSSDQVKNWLYQLGWEPATYKYVRDKNTGNERRIEQVRKDGELCPSVQLLADRDPAVDVLDGLTVIQHRMRIFKSFLQHHKDGWLKAEIAGFTNTLRFKHANPLVNLPGVERPWGKEIRGCLIAPEGLQLCGADMTSLEDTTKRHYMKPLDPDYVEEMSHDGFDPHLDLAKFADRVTQEEIDMYNAGQMPQLKKLRKSFKAVNYSATYGVGATKLARETGMSVAEAGTLLEAFWQRNWAVQRVSKDCRVRTVNGSDWLYNPVSRFWMELRSDKDRFSTLNQSTGVYCFDRWVATCRIKFGIKVIGQFHDEIIGLVAPGEEADFGDNLKKAISLVNKEVNLNVPLDVDYSFGKNYAEIH